MKIAIVGEMHSGKTASVNFLVTQRILDGANPTIVKFADPLYKAQYLFSNGLVKQREFLQELSDLAKKHFGENILNELFIQRVRNCERAGLDVFCDDLRTPSEFETAQKLGFTTIGIRAADEVRLARNPRTFTGAGHVTERDVKQVICQCDVIIDNNSTIENLQSVLKDLLATIRRKNA